MVFSCMDVFIASLHKFFPFASTVAFGGCTVCACPCMVLVWTSLFGLLLHVLSVLSLTRMVAFIGRTVCFSLHGPNLDVFIASLHSFCPLPTWSPLLVVLCAFLGMVLIWTFPFCFLLHGLFGPFWTLNFAIVF